MGREPPIAEPLDRWCGEGELNTLLYPIMAKSLYKALNHPNRYLNRAAAFAVIVSLKKISIQGGPAMCRQLYQRSSEKILPAPQLF